MAQRFGVPVTGTVGLLLKAKQEDVITAVRPLLDALDANHFRISDALRAEALRLAGSRFPLAKTSPDPAQSALIAVAFSPGFQVGLWGDESTAGACS